MHMAQARSGLGKERQRQGGAVLVQAAYHGQYHAAAVGHAFGQHQIVFGVVEIRLCQQKIQPDGLGLPRADVLDHMGMQSTAPGPAANAGQAALLHQNQHHIGGGWGLVQAQ